MFDRMINITVFPLTESQKVTDDKKETSKSGSAIDSSLTFPLIKSRFIFLCNFRNRSSATSLTGNF